MAYAGTVDLLVGDIPLGGALDPVKYVNDAADEIDSKIGFRYTTPVNSTLRPVTLLLKRLNAHLATGRLVLAATISAEDERLNAYGQSLVDEVMLTLEAIASGELPLPGATINPDVPTQESTSTEPILMGQKDPESQVEAFYDRIAFAPGGFVYGSRG